jgi:hypothetical protein
VSIDELTSRHERICYTISVSDIDPQDFIIDAPLQQLETTPPPALIVEQSGGGNSAKEGILRAASQPTESSPPAQHEDKPPHVSREDQQRINEIRTELSHFLGHGEDLIPNSAPPLENSEGKEAAQAEAWGGVSDPRQHNPQEFRYLIHSFNDFNQALSIQTVTSGFSEQQAVNLQQQPDRVADRVSLSMSLIDQAHTVTWGPGGLIVKAPESNVLIASPEDAAVSNSDIQALKEDAASRKLLSPDEVLSDTPDGKYNEIVAVGRDANGNQLELDGFFIVQDVDGDISNEPLKRHLQTLAIQKGLPFITITDARFKEDNYIATNRSVTAQFEGKRYHLKHTFGSNFQVETGAKEYFATRDEVLRLVDHLKQTGKVTDEEGVKILSDYDVAQKAVLRPTIFEDDGIGISFKTGVGQKFSEYSLRNGNVVKRTVDGPRTQSQSISLEEFTQAVEADRPNLTDEEYTRILSLIPKAAALVQKQE